MDRATREELLIKRNLAALEFNRRFCSDVKTKEHPKGSQCIRLNYTRYQMIELFRDLGYKRGVEIGVAQGMFSEHLCETIPDLHLTCVDPWVLYPGNPRSRDNAKQEECFQETQERLKNYNVDILRMQGNEAALRFPEKFFDFVYVDGNHCFDFVMMDLILWGTRVKYGGAISGDDYYEFRYAGVIPAVDTYVASHGVQTWFLTSDLSRSKRLSGEPAPSFFWFRL